MRHSALHSFLLLSLLAPSAARGEWELSDLHGKAKTRISGYLTPLTGYHDGESRTDLQAELQLTNGEVFSAKAVPWVWAYAPVRIGGHTAAGAAYGELREGWVEFAKPAWDLRLGNQIFSWGRADGINPEDVLNPRDITDPLESEKLPVLAARLRLHPESLDGWSLELVGSPLFKRSRPPAEFPESGTTALRPQDSRWLVSLPSFADTGAGLTPLEYEMHKVSYATSWMAAARLSTTTLLPNWDLGFSYFNGVENDPRISVTQRGVSGNPNLPVVIELHPSFHRQQMIGMDGSTVWTLDDDGHEMGFRFEAAMLFRDNTRAEAAASALRADLRKDDVLHAVMGVDYTFPKVAFGADLYANLQYSVYHRLGDLERAPGVTIVPGLPSALPWDRDLMLLLQVKFMEKYTFQNLLVWSHRRADALLRPSVSAEWSDTFSTRLGADLFAGNPEGFFGQFRESGRVWAGVEWVF